jgi:predicted N-acetyltransferase YhbS
MAISIRAETVRDYNGIARLTEEAFEINFLNDNKTATHIGEIALVDQLRHGEFHDPELALVAEVDGELAGHVMFTPYRVKLYGTSLLPACLSILSVPPRFQRSGVGSALVREGLQRVRRKGHPFSYLYGHESYYPKFGYSTGMFGAAGVTLAARDFVARRFEERAPEAPMLPALIGMHERSFEGVALALEASGQMMEWKSWVPFVTSSALYDGQRLFAYVRYAMEGGTLAVKRILAANAEDLAMAAGHLFSLAPQAESLALPLHPRSPVLSGLAFKPYLEAWAAGMLLVLDEGCREILRYCDDIRSDTMKLGMITWPIFFDWQ